MNLTDVGAGGEITASRFTRPKPWSLSTTAPAGPTPGILVAPAISATLSRAAVGLLMFFFFRRYSRRRATAPDTSGVAMLVPPMKK